MIPTSQLAYQRVACHFGQQELEFDEHGMNSQLVGHPIL